MKRPLTGRTLLFMLIALLLTGCSKNTPFDLEVVSEKECADSRFITVTNQGTASITLQDWSIYEDNEYVLPNTVLAAQSSVNIWSGTGTNTPENIFVGRTTDFWDVENNVQLEVRQHGNFGIFGGKIQVFFSSGCDFDLGV